MGERIIEAWIQAKHPDQELCEDGLYTGRDFFAVIDGVTSKGSLVWPGQKTGGRFAKDVLLAAMEKLPADIQAEAAVSYLNEALYTAAVRAASNPEVLERKREERPQAVLVLYSRMRREVKETDPMCMFRFKGPKGIAPGFNSFDDRTYLRFIVEDDGKTAATLPPGGDRILDREDTLSKPPLMTAVNREENGRNS